jgi:hypothetical protein
MAARLFTCHHIVPERVFRPNRLFGMLISGVRTDERVGYLGDLDGDNIAGQNVYSEMRHQYYVWRNLLGRYDYVGFEHYRRVFFIDPARAAIARAGDPQRWWWRAYFNAGRNIAYSDTSAEHIEAYLNYRSSLDVANCRAVEAWMSDYDIIVQRSFMQDGLEQQWKSCQPHEMWDVIMTAVRESLAETGAGCDIDTGVRTGYFNNMYIMRSDIFDQYMTFYMKCAERILSRAPSYQRMLGHCGERIFSLWLFQRMMDDPRLRLHEQPFLQSSQTLVPNLPGDFKVAEDGPPEAELPFLEKPGEKSRTKPGRGRRAKA